MFVSLWLERLLGLDDTKAQTAAAELHCENTVEISVMEPSAQSGEDRVDTITLDATADGSTALIRQRVARVTLSGSGRSGAPVRDTPKVRSSRISEYKWAPPGAGRLLAAHRDGRLLAYSLSLPPGGAVRVYDCESKGRALIKSFIDACTDLSWSFTQMGADPLLACLDTAGNVYVYSVATPPPGAQHHQQLVMKKFCVIMRSTYAPATAPVGTAAYRCVWCPYAPEDSADGGRAAAGNSTAANSESTAAMAQAAPENVPVHATNSAESVDEMAHCLAVYKGKRVELLLLDTIVDRFGPETNFDALAGTQDGYVVIEDDDYIMSAWMSPDATALALATERTGAVKFYILENLDDVRPARSWFPHDGAPVESLFFLDNLSMASTEDTFWKVAVTMAKGNRELKLWSCVMWQCLGVLNIEPSLVSSAPLRPAIDPTGCYVFLADEQRKALYCIELAPTEGPDAADNSAAFPPSSAPTSTASGGSDGKRFASFSDFPLCKPIYDMVVLKVVRTAHKTLLPLGAECYSSAELGAYHSVQALLIVVNPKTLLEIEVQFVSASAGDLTRCLSPCVPEADTQSGYLRQHEDPLSDLSCNISGTEATPSILATIDSTLPSGRLFGPPSPSTTGNNNKEANNTSRQDNNNTASTPVHEVGGIQSAPPSSRVPVDAELQRSSSGGFEIGRGTLDQALATIMKASGRSKDDSGPAAERAESPGSREVFDILSHQQSKSTGLEPDLEEGELLDDDNGVDGDDDDDGDEEACGWLDSEEVSYSAYDERDADSATPDAQSDAVNERKSRRRQPIERPETPVAHTLATIPTGASSLSGMGMAASGSAPLGGTASSSHWRSSTARQLSTDTPTASAADHRHIADMRNSLAKMSMELERLVCHMQRQEDELASLKQNLVPEEHHVHKELKSLADAVHDNNSSIKHVHSMLLSQREQVAAQLDSIVAAQQQAHEQNAKPPTVDLEPIKRELKVATSDMHKHVADTLNTAVQRTSSKMEQEFKTRVSNTDVALREAVVRAATSKPTLDVLASSVVHGVKENVSTSYREAFRHVIVPAFEEHTKRMFNEINKTFQSGTKDYLEQVRTAAERDRSETERRRVALETHVKDSVEKARAELQVAAQKVAHDTGQTMEQHAKQMEKKLVESTVASVRTALREELSRGLADQRSMLAESIRHMNQMSSVVGSRGNTPAPAKPDADRQAVLKEVLLLAQQKSYEQAFSKALSACDMGILMQLCQKVDPKDVFEPCPLPQPVLMSLLQQLSHEIAVHTDIKLAYIEGAFMALDPAAVENAAYMPRIVNRIVSTMNTFIASAPSGSGPDVRKARLIKMAAQSLSPVAASAGASGKVAVKKETS